MEPLRCVVLDHRGVPCGKPAAYLITVSFKLDGERAAAPRCCDHKDHPTNVHFDVVGLTPIQ